MRVGINLLFMLPAIVGGQEVYAAELIRGLYRNTGADTELVIFVNRESRDWPLLPASRVRRVVCPVDALDRSARYQYEQTRLPGLLREHGVDLVHSLGYVAPLKPPCPSVVSVPDLNFAVLKELAFIRRMALGFFVSQSIVRADHVITISEHSRRQIVAAYGIAPDRVSVTYLASSVTKPAAEAVARFKQAHGLTQPYVLAFGSPSPHKNIDALVEAFRRFRRRHDVPHRLVIAGHLPAGFSPPRDERVLVMGYLDDESRTAVLAGADVFAFPSTYEGFGMPILEAMACDVPVASSNAACLPEIGGDAALYFDPQSVEEMTAALAEITRAPITRHRLVEHGRENLRRFNWDATARATWSVYAATAGSAAARLRVAR